MGPEPRIFGKISGPIGTEIFSLVLDTNNELHVLYPLVFILRMNWAGKVTSKGEHTYIHTYVHTQF